MQLNLLKKREFRNLVKEWLYRFKYLKLNINKTNDKRYGIAMIDGRNWHGGLTDRLKGIISFYNYCSDRNITFKIYYNYPYMLTEYLIPNKYNWIINESEIPKNILFVRPFIGIGETGQRLLKLKTKKIILYYGNRDFGRYIQMAPYNTNWGEIFKFLFKPSPLLINALEQIKKQLNKDYIAVVYRFQNLLGDFSEYNFKEITNQDKKNKLLNKSIEELCKIHEKYPSVQILVTSDSSSFLKIIKGISYVYVIPGKIEHVDCIKYDTNHSQLKSFLDFFMIADAQKVYSIVIGNMYKSEFPEYAAKINNKPFYRIEIKI